MKTLGTTLALVTALGAVACGSDNNPAIDAAKSADAKVFKDAKIVDAKPIDAKVFEDAPVKSTVNVVANCTGITPNQIGATVTTSDSPIAFSASTLTITVGQYVKFTSSGFHNFTNQPGAAANSTFVSGDPGSHTACLQFTVAGTYPFWCAIHMTMMEGVLTVN